MELPGDISVTAVDVAAHPDIAQLAAGRGELTGLALWLMAERQKVGFKVFGCPSSWVSHLSSFSCCCIACKPSHHARPFAGNMLMRTADPHLLEVWLDNQADGQAWESGLQEPPGMTD